MAKLSVCYLPILLFLNFQWMQLKNRKQNLVRLLEQMQQYQFDQITPDKPLEASFRRLGEEDIDRFAICFSYKNAIVFIKIYF